MQIEISETSDLCGRKAAIAGAGLIRHAIAARGEANIILATGVSQFDMLTTLVAEPEIDWSRVTAFHLDEYAGLPIAHPASFRRYLKERFVDALPVSPAGFHYIDGEGDLAGECRRLGKIIAVHPIDVAFIGIGENGHLAFNDPPADFETDEPYLVVTLDEACRRQQLGEGWFPTLPDVPTQAISMSVKQILKAEHIICTVPDDRKSVAVRNAINGPVTPNVPASNLQTHASVRMYLDTASATLL